MVGLVNGGEGGEGGSGGGMGGGAPVWPADGSRGFLGYGESGSVMVLPQIMGQVGFS